jgi:hypothetical protein
MPTHPQAQGVEAIGQVSRVEREASAIFVGLTKPLIISVNGPPSEAITQLSLVVMLTIYKIVGCVDKVTQFLW